MTLQRTVTTSLANSTRSKLLEKAAALSQGLVELTRTQSAYLWDQRFPDIETFVVAAMNSNLDAVARTVEVHGLYGAADILGDIVWHSFDKYRRYLPPKKRQAMEAVWLLHQSLN